MSTELEELIIRLTGDAEEYKEMLETAIDETQRTAREVREAAENVESFKDRLNDLAETAANAFAAIGLGGGLRDLLNTFSTQEDNEIRLQAAIRASGQVVEEQFPILAEWASAMQQVTRVGDEVTLGMLQQSYSLGVTGPAAQRAVRNAIALAAAQDMNARAAIRMTTSLEQGNTSMLARYLPNLRNLTSESERVRYAQEQLAQMFEVELALAQTTSGRLKQLSDVWGDLKEVLGGVVAIGIGPVVRWMKLMIDNFHALDPVAKRNIATTVVLTMAVAGLSTGLRVLAGILLLIKRRFILLLVASAAVALLIHRFGGLEEVLGNIEGRINDALNIDPNLIPQLGNQGFDAGHTLGEEFTRGVSMGTEGVRGILFGSAEAAVAIAAHMRRLMAPVVGGAATGAGGQPDRSVTSPWATDIIRPPDPDMGGVFGFGGLMDQITFMFLDVTSIIAEQWAYFGFLAEQAWNIVSGFAQTVWNDFLTNMDIFFNQTLPNIANIGWDLITSGGLAVWENVLDWMRANLPGFSLISSGIVEGAVRRQHGGPVTAGSPYIVGEAGPELFVPGQSGNIVPMTAGNMRNGAGGDGTAQIVAALNKLDHRLKMLTNKPTLFVEPVGLR